MKIISEKVVKGKRRVTVELDEGEQVLAIRRDSHYRLGYPLEDQVIHSSRIENATEVYWCDGEQNWNQRG